MISFSCENQRWFAIMAAWAIRCLPLLLAQSSFAVAPIIVGISAGGGQVSLSFSSDAPHVYRVQFKSDLNSPSWTDLPGDIIGTGSVIVKNDSAAGFSRFYRVRDLTTGEYSLDTAGYVNLSLGAAWNLIADPFALSNRVENLFPSLPDFSKVQKVGTDGFECSVYDTGEWLDCTASDVSTMFMLPGEGALLNPGAQ